MASHPGAYSSSLAFSLNSSIVISFFSHTITKLQVKHKFSHIHTYYNITSSVHNLKSYHLFFPHKAQERLSRSPASIYSSDFLNLMITLAVIILFPKLIMNFHLVLNTCKLSTHITHTLFKCFKLCFKIIRRCRKDSSTLISFIPTTDSSFPATTSSITGVSVYDETASSPTY